MKGWLVLLFGCFIFLFNVSNVLASGFHLNSIGNMQTGGRQLNKWWYSSASPAFHGEGVPGAEVIVDIDGTAVAINADSSGNWDYQASGLTSGDHSIKFTSEGSTIAFTLTIGSENVNWESVESGNVETMPTVGTTTPTIFLLVLGLGMGLLSGKMVNHVK